MNIQEVPGDWALDRFGIGQPVRRTEDPRLVRGQGRFTDDIPAIHFESHPVPATSNPLGAKGCGEAGCAGALTAVANAIVDALAHLGIQHFDLPATLERVWRAIEQARTEIA